MKVPLLSVLLVACADRPPPSWPATEPPPQEPPAPAPGAPPTAPTENVPAGAFDMPEGGCSPAEGDPVCSLARALPIALTSIPTKLNGLAPLPGGKVHNRSARDIYAIGSVPAGRASGPWEIVRVPAGASLGGDLRGEAPMMTTDVDWVSAMPPTSDGRGAFTYRPSAVGVKVSDGGELTVIDRPGGGVRFDMTANGPVAQKITTAGQMNGGSAIVYVPPR